VKASGLCRDLGTVCVDREVIIAKVAAAGPGVKDVRLRY